MGISKARGIILSVQEVILLTIPNTLDINFRMSPIFKLVQSNINEWLKGTWPGAGADGG